MTAAVNEGRTGTAGKMQRSTNEKYLTFRMGTESYGLAVLKVREIIRMQNITVVPQMPEYVKGVINLRGRVIPVIDLPLRFDLGRHETTDLTSILVLHVHLADYEEKLVRIVVDAAEEVLNIVDSDIEEAPDFGCKLSAAYISGMAKSKGSVKTILDIDKVINDTNVEIPIQ